MPNAFDISAQRMFADPNMTVQATYRVATDDAADLPIILIRARRPDIEQFSRASVSFDTVTFEALASSWSGPVKDAVLTVGGAVYRVQSHRFVSDGRILALDTVPYVEDEF